MDERTKRAKEALEKKGYKFPELKTAKARAAFVKKNGYDPEGLIESTVISMRFRPDDWAERIPKPPKK